MGARISQGPKRVPAARGIKMSTNHTPVDHSARIVPGKRGSTPRSLQARYSVSDDEWPTSHSPCSEQLNGPNQLCYVRMRNVLLSLIVAGALVAGEKSAP